VTLATLIEQLKNAAAHVPELGVPVGAIETRECFRAVVWSDGDRFWLDGTVCVGDPDDSESLYPLGPYGLLGTVHEMLTDLIRLFRPSPLGLQEPLPAWWFTLEVGAEMIEVEMGEAPF
jgi:hypothetical protein